MSTYKRTYSSFMEVSIQPIEAKKILYHFPRPDEEEINKILTTPNGTIGLEIILKNIHSKFKDQGLQYTLIHKVFFSSNNEIEHYVPELVYIAIRKNCKPMKKLLIYKASSCESLRRLILWNVKAFTVLMKEKDSNIKQLIDTFEEELIATVKNKAKFNKSQKAIALITQASLTLKKMPPEVIGDKLKKFIKRYNREYLNNVAHQIIIPFRRESHERFDSNYIVHIVEDDCSCFPTRKRVPYRIILQTIDQRELANCMVSQKDFPHDVVEPDEERDLFNEVHEIVEKNKTGFMDESKYPYTIDTTENARYSQMKMFIKDVEKEEIKEQLKTLSRSRTDRKNSISFNLDIKRKQSLDKYKIKESEGLKKFQAIYIPNKMSTSRKSEDLQENVKTNYQEELEKSRLSFKKMESIQMQESRTNQVQEEVNYVNFAAESIWGKSWASKNEKYKKDSIFSKMQSLKLRNVVVKGGDDLRQEIICMQLIYKMRDIVKKAQVNVMIKPYEIIVLSQNSGILEFVSNSISIDQMKKKTENSSIVKFFQDVYEMESKVKEAKQNFARSLAGSCILTYVLKIRDRHNGNILLDLEGNIIQIDFGFILGMSPGKFNFQSSPFKLTFQYIEVLGGKNTSNYNNFVELFCDGMQAIRQKSAELWLLLEIMMEESDLDCFQDFKIETFKESFKPALSDKEYRQYCYALVERSCMNSRTVHYDTFQYYTNGILP